MKMYCKIKRPDNAKKQIEKGEKIVKNLNGFFARLVQHECDHLKGVVFLEKVKEHNGFATIDNVMKYNLRNI